MQELTAQFCSDIDVEAIRNKTISERQILMDKNKSIFSGGFINFFEFINDLTKCKCFY